MTSPLKDLAAATLRGTARAEVPVSGAAPLAQALARVPEGRPENVLLARAALTGLHARAGAPLMQAATPPPQSLPAAARPLPAPLWPLMRALMGTQAAFQALNDVQTRGWTLTATQGLTLHQDDTQSGRAALLWPLLDERAQSVLDAHPLHRAWAKAEAAKQWQGRLESLREAREADASAGAAQTLELWKEVDADGRRDLLDILERDLRAEDLPLLQHAEKDRSAEVQRRARMLQGHLPGPLQDELLALLPSVVVRKGQKLTFRPFDLPAALGQPKKNAYDDSDLLRLLGAVPFGLLLETLNVSGNELLKAAHQKHWALGHLLERADMLSRVSAPAVPAPEENPAENQMPRDAADLLRLLQTEGSNWSVTSELDDLARTLDPATVVPAPLPVPFVMPPAPKQLPRWQTKEEWELRQAEGHAGRQVEAEAAWRTLTETLRLRGEWVAALEAQR